MCTRLNCQNGYLQPTEGSNMWPESSIQSVLPPVERRPPGRPKKAGKKKFDEDGKSSAKPSTATLKVSKKKYLQMTCSHCGFPRHNKEKCKNPPKVVNPQGWRNLQYLLLPRKNKNENLQT